MIYQPMTFKSPNSTPRLEEFEEESGAGKENNRCKRDQDRCVIFEHHIGP